MRVELKTYSYQGMSFGATHTMGYLQLPDCNQIQLKRVVTPLVAAELKYPHPDHYLAEIGILTDQFMSEWHVRQFAVAHYKELCPTATCLMFEGVILDPMSDDA